MKRLGAFGIISLLSYAAMVVFSPLAYPGYDWLSMLHNEARKLLIEAVGKKRKVQEVADCYSVNRSTVYRLKKRWKETGSFETRTFLRGRKPALSPEKLASIDQLVKDKPDVTLQEIVDTLHLTVSIETVRKALLKLGYRRKKKAFHASEQERPRCGGEAESTERHYLRVQRK